MKSTIVRVCAGLCLCLTPVVAGCSSPSVLPAPSTSAATNSASGSLGPGFFGAQGAPAPEGTASPEPGSWDDVHPPKGYRVVLLTYGEDQPTQTLVHAVHDWAQAEDVELSVVRPASPGKLIKGIYTAVARKADLIISAGDALVDPLAAITPSELDQEFLVVGAELAEPTSNVTAADWTGAGFRGEGLGKASSHDPTTFTSERAGRALRAGVASVLSGYSGIVVWIK